jgi:hypothetical protein
MPTIDLTDDEFAAVTAAVGRAIEDDKFPHAPRLDPLLARPASQISVWKAHGKQNGCGPLIVRWPDGLIRARPQ